MRGPTLTALTARDNNFEIVSRRFFESEAYQTWFRFVDRNATGIYSRRWGDAPIRSAGLSLFLPPEQVAFFGHQIGCASAVLFRADRPDEHEWTLATPQQPWLSMFCDELPDTTFKLPANSHANWYGFDPIVEPAFDPAWLHNDAHLFREDA